MWNFVHTLDKITLEHDSPAKYNFPLIVIHDFHLSFSYLLVEVAFSFCLWLPQTDTAMVKILDAVRFLTIKYAYGGLYENGNSVLRN